MGEAWLLELGQGGLEVSDGGLGRGDLGLDVQELEAGLQKGVCWDEGGEEERGCWDSEFLPEAGGRFKQPRLDFL